MAKSNIPPRDNRNKNNDHVELVSLDASILLATESTHADIHSIRIKQENVESIIFIWLDPQEKSGLNLVGQLRAINHHVQVFNDTSTCINAIKFSQENIFFITSSVDSRLIAMMHNLASVEAIFILAPNVESIKGDFPKIFGIFPQHEELLRTLKEIFDIFEQIQLESFVFEHDKLFLWSQLWKEELMNRKISSKKETFVAATRQHYRDNVMINRIIDEFDKSYRSTEVLKWCFHSPFPSRFLHHALRSHNQEQLHACHFLFSDASRFFQQSAKRKSTEKVYRGMKLSGDLLDILKAHTGQLVCTNGFFPCIKSRTNALTLASIPAYRTDLLPVLFKIDCDASVPFIEVADKYSAPLMVFDVCTSFRILYVNRDQMTIIKMRTASDAGKKIALDFIEQHQDKTLQSLLGELMRQPIPPKPASIPVLRSTSRPNSNSQRDSTLTLEEIKAQKCIEKGEIDRALAIYQRIQPVTPRILNAIGQICADRKEDYKHALQCHIKALKMQEEAGENISDTLTNLGNVYHNCNQYDLALNCHTRALALHQSSQTPDSAAIASNLIGIANTHWALHEYPEAIDHVQRALTIRESFVPPNKPSIAATIAILASIYQDCGNIGLAIDLSKKALNRFESLPSTDPSILADLHYDLGTMQISTDSFDDAYHSFESAVKIYNKILPQGHPDRVAAEHDLQRVVDLHKKKKTNK
ncbi:unnamed protein product [Rotaria magnacalcarata]|uniref:Uncharacterized protein n=4 Tax=Rotaria magnacalcarata TaxID=392030 RepID=A0A818ZD01_9BILA|nr:unnamed protein product [Rotaria magnacalcarata]CAF2063683.1 unnamed protein product [Rotaria magnacalcarata]CAF2069042.1 unnamed protein product [Rotaria magnacalcarata]CAF3767450.1 unnamed protein product [Rotaria magnacalcarata]CAF3818969.1 unnamed protein product [Rotaria magnacalcarata]